MLLVSHDVSMVSRVAQRVLCLKDGRIDCQGEPQTILMLRPLISIGQTPFW